MRRRHPAPLDPDDIAPARPAGEIRDQFLK